ncbi:translation elongation factor Ts [Candidatus Chromulinivorax destructor]|uniref:Elongation factor Ts n=1 Tax=Candidatus Chromulinivorax destructor TaxID=2066483 RepID=A0A345ZCR8_9BACT|nr:translation elongation factor Ts [Candidatus Chromulinivorax destructor]AXK61085.1 translation elongation factor Ts [Candidatus Chromulinivorax destructor]
MAKVSLSAIQELRQITGLGMLDCKNALEATDGNIEKAIEELRKKGTSIAGKRAGNATTQGIVVSYIHPGDQTGVLVELNCETDFVARTSATKAFAQDIAMHIAAMKPLYLDNENVDAAFLAKEEEIARELLKNEGKPAAMIDKIVEGKMKKIFSEVCLLKQSFVKDETKTIEELLKELIAKTGENIKIKRFARFEVGN